MKQVTHNQPYTDVWTLESPNEMKAIDLLNVMYIEPALKGNRKAINYLKKLWDEPWQSIKAKLLTEGSAWYVWWMDGVRQFIINLRTS